MFGSRCGCERVRTAGLGPHVLGMEEVVSHALWMRQRVEALESRMTRAEDVQRQAAPWVDGRMQGVEARVQGLEMEKPLHVNRLQVAEARMHAVERHIAHSAKVNTVREAADQKAAWSTFTRVRRQQDEINGAERKATALNEEMKALVQRVEAIEGVQMDIAVNIAANAAWAAENGVDEMACVAGESEAADEAEGADEAEDAAADRWDAEHENAWDEPPRIAAWCEPEDVGDVSRKSRRTC